MMFALSLTLIAIVLLAGTVRAIQIQYVVSYRNNYGYYRELNELGMTVTTEQAARIKANIWLWSQEHYTASEQGSHLRITNFKLVLGTEATQAMLDNMKALVEKHSQAG